MRKLPIEEIPRASIDEFQAQAKLPLVAVLDDIRSRSNVGSIFRSADAFALERLVLCGFTPTPPHREIHKTALGAEQSMAFKHTEDPLEALEQLKADGYELLALEHTDTSVPIQTYTPATGKVALILGNEVSGVNQHVLDMCDRAVEIPQFGTKHSLNVGVAAGVAFYALRERLMS